MSAASNGPVRPTVLLVVQQLRRSVPGGIGTYARGLLYGLAGLERERGLTVATVTLYASWTPSDPLEDYGREVRRVPLPSRMLTRAWDRGVLLAPRHYDIVHAVSLGAPGMRRGSRSALVVTVHDLTWRRFPETSTRRGRQWHEAALKRAIGEAKAFVVPSSNVKEELVESGARPNSVTVIAEGADHLPPPQPERAAALLDRAEVRGPYLLTASTLEPRKNLGRLLRAYAAARSEGLELPLVVVGPRGWGNPGLSQAPTDGVVPLGPVDDAVLAALYRGTNAFVYVPLAEGFGLPPLEAMAQGVPVVVSSAVPSVGDEASEPVALLVQAEDTDDIAAALLRITSDRPLAASLAERGAAFAGSRTWRAAAGRHLELWARLS